jgi:hypothetical protein
MIWATCRASEVTLKEIRQALRARQANPKQQFRRFRETLSALSGGADSILVCRERANQPLYRFRDPLMRAYVRLVHELGLGDSVDDQASSQEDERPET